MPRKIAVVVTPESSAIDDGHPRMLYNLREALTSRGGKLGVVQSTAAAVQFNAEAIIYTSSELMEEAKTIAKDGMQVVILTRAPQNLTVVSRENSNYIDVVSALLG